MRLLYIEASPRKNRSHSIKVARAFLNQYQQVNPEHTIDLLDLWDEDLPPFDGAMIRAKYAVIHQKDPSEDEQRAWQQVKTIAMRFISADKIVFSIPMWNFHIPYRLKHYIDIITQPGITFKGNQGLVPSKPVLIIYSSGGSYPTGSPAEKLDYQKPYIRMWLKYIGLSQFHEIIDDSTMRDDNSIEEKSLAEAQALASSF